eukprot:scaffold2795_cov106-Isochrysis_galbana.AAC.11
MSLAQQKPKRNQDGSEKASAARCPRDHARGAAPLGLGKSKGSTSTGSHRTTPAGRPLSIDDVQRELDALRDRRTRSPPAGAFTPVAPPPVLRCIHSSCPPPVSVNIHSLFTPYWC